MKIEKENAYKDLTPIGRPLCQKSNKEARDMFETLLIQTKDMVEKFITKKEERLKKEEITYIHPISILWLSLFQTPQNHKLSLSMHASPSIFLIINILIIMDITKSNG